MTESLQMAMHVATLRMKMTVEESLTAATSNGAASVRMAEETGSIEPGKRGRSGYARRAELSHLVYHFGVNL